MSEQLSVQYSPERRINDVELARLGAMAVEASMRSDLILAGEQQAAVAGCDNPNSVGREAFLVGAGEVPMSEANVYRQVGIEAVEDLGKSGVVRNGATAQGEKHRRWGDKVFWHPGVNQKSISTGGRVILEADKATAQSRWVTADKVKGIYARDSDGIVKNIIP